MAVQSVVFNVKCLDENTCNLTFVLQKYAVLQNIEANDRQRDRDFTAIR